MGKDWTVSVPIVGRMDVFVIADSEEEARHKALNGDWEESEVIETEIVERCRGSVCQLQGGIEIIQND